ncbi:MAG: UDP-N-acetylmuramate dehydrogenase [Patescibacteria group bacterium]
MEDMEKYLFDKLGPEIKQNYPLRDLTSLRVGGVADYFFAAESIADLTAAVSAASSKSIPYFILGGGYNIVPADAGFPGLVIKNESNNIVFNSESSTVIVDSGVSLGRLINLAAGRDLGGLEFLFGVPGTVGGAVYGNAGAFGHAIGDFVKSITLLIPRVDKISIVRHDASWMDFCYRSSRLKEKYTGQNIKPVILTVTLQLAQRRKDEILRLMQVHIGRKKETQPVAEFSAGSFFKNPDKSTAAGLLLDQAGVKKLKFGDACFSKKHANFLINRKNAKASDVRLLAEKAKELVRQKYGIDLEEEIEYIGKW